MVSDMPSPYSNTDTAETLAVNTFSSLVDPSKVKLDINLRDKYPNTDGYMELVNVSGVPIGKLEVQIKKLPDNFNPEKPKIKIKKSLLSYSNTGTANPVLHIGVDTSTKTAYWVYVHDNLTNTRGERLIDCSYETTLIPLNLDNIDNGFINIDEIDYVSSWKLITKKHIDLSNDHDKLIEKFHELEIHSEPTLGEYSDDFVSIHVFLDELNEKLGYFDIIKDRFYFSDTWKLGLVYKLFSDYGLSYSLYPIPYNKNDVQIKKINLDDNVLDGFIESRSVTGHFGNNPIKSNPKDYAKEVIKLNTLQILKDRLLLPCNDFIAKEIIFAVLDNSYGLLEDFYHLKDIKNITSEKEVINKYKNYDYLNPYSFTEALKFLDSTGKKGIKRNYFPFDYKRNPNNPIIWNRLSFNSTKKNLETFFNNLPYVYNEILMCNFPKISDELPLFKKASKLIVSYFLKDKYDSLEDMPRLKIFYLKSIEPEDFNISFFDMKESVIIDFTKEYLSKISKRENNEIEFENNVYQPISYSYMPLDFIYNETPMLNYMYGTLESNFEIFFKNWK